MDRGMICPSLVFDHFRYSPNCAFEYQHEDGVVVFISFVSKVFPDTWAEDGQIWSPIPSCYTYRLNLICSWGLGLQKKWYMPIYRITVNFTKVTSGQRIDKGLYVDIQTYTFTNPILTEKKKVADAFRFQRGVDIEKMGALNCACLTAKRIG